MQREGRTQSGSDNAQFCASRPIAQFVNFDNRTSSVLKLVPSMHDHGAVLTCRAVNAHFNDAPVEDQLKLHVQCNAISLSLFRFPNLYFSTLMRANEVIRLYRKERGRGGGRHTIKTTI